MKEQNNEWYQHEGLDRTHMLLAMLQEALGYVDEDSDEVTTHPSIWNKKSKKLLSKATTALADCIRLLASGRRKRNDPKKNISSGQFE